jgi:hypothetical protein
MKIIVFSIFFFVVSCTWDVETIPVNNNYALSDANSKVWLVNSLIKNNYNFIQPDYLERDLIIFYVSGKCRIVKWKDFSSKKGDVFHYKLIRSEKSFSELLISRKDKRWKFRIILLSNDKIVVKPVEGTDFKYEMSLIPLPEW